MLVSKIHHCPALTQTKTNSTAEINSVHYYKCLIHLAKFIASNVALDVFYNAKVNHLNIICCIITIIKNEIETFWAILVLLNVLIWHKKPLQTTVARRCPVSSCFSTSFPSHGSKQKLVPQY